MTAGSISFTRGEDPLRADKLNSAFAERVLLTGDTMTGPLLLSRAPAVPTEAATKNYVDGLVTTQLTGFLSTTGGTLTGFLTLNANPVNPLHAASKQYVDNSEFLPLAGGTMTGLLTAGLNGGGGAEIRINSAAGTTRYLSYATAGQMRWRVYASGTAEGGSNAGSDYVIDRFADAGTLLGTALTIARNTGIAAFTASPTAPTPIVGDSSTKLATTAYVNAQFAASGTITEAPVDGAIYGRVSSSWTPVLSLAGSAGNVGRNLLHNPLFNVQQRGPGNFTTNGAYTADRWAINMAGDTVSFGLIPPGVQAGLDESAAFVLRNTFTGTSGAGSYTQITQKIEKVSRLSGQTVTLSFTAQPSAAGLKLGANLYQVFGTGGSPSAGAFTQATGAAFTLSTGWVRYSATFVIPSISGKTLGTNGDDYTQLCLFYSSGSASNAFSGNIGVQSGTIYLWGVQLEIGSVATPLEKPDPQQDLAKCQRFYQIGAFRMVSYQVAGASSSILQPLPVVMRAVPTLVPTNTVQTNCAGVTTAWDVQSITPTASVTATGTFVLQGTFTASADL